MISPDQLELFSPETAQTAGVPPPAEPDLSSYDAFVVYFSAGKDSFASFLTLLEAGVPAEKIEWWHHLIDGREGSRLMDWPVTEGYTRKAAETFGVRLYFSWKGGGFEGEMLRDNQPTRPTWFETPEDVLWFTS